MRNRSGMRPLRISKRKWWGNITMNYKYGGNLHTTFIGLRIWANGERCKHSIEPSGSVKFEEFLN
jgi:hypothetical protein